MNFKEAMGLIKYTRKITPVALREVPSGVAITYQCSCSLSIEVIVCHGVSVIQMDEGIVRAPTGIECPLCKGRMAPKSAYEVSLDESPDGRPFLRVPSRKAALQMANEGRAEGQFVMPPEFLERFQ